MGKVKMKNVNVTKKAMEIIGKGAGFIYAFLSALVYTIVLMICGAGVATYYLIKKIIKETLEKK